MDAPPDNPFCSALEEFRPKPLGEPDRDPWGRIFVAQPTRFPSWVPPEVRADIRAGLPDGLTRYPSEPAGPETIVWSRVTNGFRDVQVFQYFPEDEGYYLARTGGDAAAARILQKSLGEWNRAMRHFVEDLGWSPDEARAEIRRIDAEVFKLALLAAATLVSAGADLAALAALARRGSERRVEAQHGGEPSATSRPARSQRRETPEVARSEEAGSAPKLTHGESPARGPAPVRGDPETGGFARGISADEVANINRAIGSHGVDYAHPSSAVAAASRYEGFWNKCAAMVREIAGRHMFGDGNKRTALEVVKLLKERNGIRSGVSDAEMRRIILEVADGTLQSVDDIAQRLRGF
ncbi:type II toxin-antitoxin system death-on-curing family toxin [Myxococcota bacterium]|nr:type II toxin-antitoxin system death-on-curing family toxin [Myxococcota bacterium]